MVSKIAKNPSSRDAPQGGVIKRVGLTCTVSNALYLNGGNGHVEEASEEAHDQAVNHADHIVRKILVYLPREKSKHGKTGVNDGQARILIRQPSSAKRGKATRP